MSNSFRTEVRSTAGPQNIPADGRVLCVGSCFADRMAKRLIAMGIRTTANPSGILYHPTPIAALLERLLADRRYTENDLFRADDGLWHSYQHHGSFSSQDRGEALQHMNAQFDNASEQLAVTDVLIITLGTAFAYVEKESGRVVANCHKQKSETFRRELSAVSQLVQQLGNVLDALRQQHANIRVVLTVSPVRHLRDSAPLNQVSKSTLILACHELVGQRDGVDYFPAYEIVLDDLRDYRFYEADMVHPNDMAVDYIWSQFRTWCFGPETASYFEEITALRKQLAHRSLHPGSAADRKFRQSLTQAVKEFCGRYPHVDLGQE